MKITIEKTPKNYDSDRVRIGEYGLGFIAKDDKTLGLEKCPECRRENYAMNVLSGICTWCGWDVHTLEDEIIKLLEIIKKS